ncbi:MAG: ABC transporter substrate-binding protein, partial [Candidatus Lambdaproteobacteria bacterium]|nr:ABC transporter substrate-binding protein [Candidatus Lambdaproteobacteria bacterium]
AALWLGACTSETPPPDALVVAIEAAPKTLDPFLATDAYGVRIGHQLLFDTLLRLDEQLHIAPGVALRWEALTPLSYRLHLAPDVRFHDGSALTADDVVYTLESLMDPALSSPYGAGLRDKIAAVRAEDARTVRIDLKAPYAAFLGDLIVPVRSRAAGRGNPLLGSGPYRLVAEQPGELVLARNEAWFGGRPGIPRVIFKVIKDTNTRLLKFRKGSLDLAINAVPMDKVASFGEAPLSDNYRVEEAPGLSYQYLGFNLDDPLLGRLAVRQALAQAIDVAALIRHRQREHAVRAVSLLPPDSPFAARDLPPPPFDPARARALLDAAGLPERDGTRFELIYKTTTDHEAVLQARAIQSDLRAVGIALTLRSYEWGTFYDDIQKGNFQLFSLRWIGVADPDFYFELFHSSRLPPEGRNRVRYRNPRLDALLERGRLESDPAARAATYRAVQHILAADLPYLSLWHNNNIAIVSRRVRGLRLHPSGGFEFLPAARLGGS